MRGALDLAELWRASQGVIIDAMHRDTPPAFTGDDRIKGDEIADTEHQIALCCTWVHGLVEDVRCTRADEGIDNGGPVAYAKGRLWVPAAHIQCNLRGTVEVFCLL